MHWMRLPISVEHLKTRPSYPRASAFHAGERQGLQACMCCAIHSRRNMPDVTLTPRDETDRMYKVLYQQVCSAQGIASAAPSTSEAANALRAQKRTGTSGVAPSETGMAPAGRTIFLHMGQVRSRASQVLMQASQKKWLHVSLMGVLIGSCTAHLPHVALVWVYHNLDPRHHATSASPIVWSTTVPDNIPPSRTIQEDL